MTEVNGTRFRVGAGIHDITGPAAEREMMGYVMMTPPQETAGIHMRLRARAFVVCSPRNGKRCAIVSCDLGMVFQAVKLSVVERMKARCDGLYTADNILVSATHTHCSVGGWGEGEVAEAFAGGFQPGLRVWFADRFIQCNFGPINPPVIGNGHETFGWSGDCNDAHTPITPHPQHDQQHAC